MFALPLSMFFTFSICHAANAGNESFLSRPELNSFIDEMVEKHGFDKSQLIDVFSHVQLKPNIIKAMVRPAESKPWTEYRAMFVNPLRINGGVEFWRANAGILALASKTYGVPESIIVAIIGVETQYGKNTGSYRVIDALSTLAFDYPRRAEFFRGELEKFLILTRDEGIEPFSLKGSYAGAMGIGQFMPGSCLSYALDFDGNGHRDINHSMADAIGSVANYFIGHGWLPGQPVALRAHVTGERYLELVNMGFNLTHTVDEMREFGVTPSELVDDSQQAMLIRLETKGEPEYWIGLNNFKAITEYNRSKFYAMTVYLLSREIQAVMNAQSINMSGQATSMPTK
ncbi:lytic murein transglycosylase B [Sulfurirhabdus autotrophica]|nr:lytic murein transglycosylase B [Sulfurirhabdus autotrophica]